MAPSVATTERPIRHFEECWNNHQNGSLMDDARDMQLPMVVILYTFSKRRKSISPKANYPQKGMPGKAIVCLKLTQVTMLS